MFSTAPDRKHPPGLFSVPGGRPADSAPTAAAIAFYAPGPSKLFSLKSYKWFSAFYSRFLHAKMQGPRPPRAHFTPPALLNYCRKQFRGSFIGPIVFLTCRFSGILIFSFFSKLFGLRRVKQKHAPLLSFSAVNVERKLVWVSQFGLPALSLEISICAVFQKSHSPSVFALKGMFFALCE